MRAFKRRRRMLDQLTSVHSENPLTGVANLFDASIVFAVGLMVALIQAFSLTQMLSPSSELTIMKRDDKTGQMEIIEKKGETIKVRRMTPEKKAGEGKRLGIAYQLTDGSVVYVPESETPPPSK
jgi:hypothetical protein